MKSLLATRTGASRRRSPERSFARSDRFFLAAALLTMGSAVTALAGTSVAFAEPPVATLHSASPVAGTAVQLDTPPTSPPNAPPPNSASPSVDIVSPAAGAFIGSATIVVSGSRSADVGVRLRSTNGVLCELPPDGTTEWRCSGLALPSGESVKLRAEAIVDNEVVASYDHSVAVLRPPTITGGATNGEVSNGIIRGTGFPGATVTATLNTGEGCSFGVDTGGSWSCLLPAGIASGQYTVTATQSANFGGSVTSDSSSSSLRIDSIPPTAPTLRSDTRTPIAGAAIRLSGSGEAGTTITVSFGASTLCTAPVNGESWSCTVILGAGNFELRAVAEDAAGNRSTGSAILPLTVAAANVPPPAPAPTSSPTNPATSTPTPAASQPTEPPVIDPSVAPLTPSDAGAGAGRSPAAGWSDTTNFARVIADASADPLLWPRSIGIALAGLLLLAIPVRLLANALGPDRNKRIRRAFAGMAGRNRSSTEFEVSPTLSLRPWVVGSGVVVLAGVLAILARPIQSEPAYLRLVVAIILALAALNTTVVAVGMLLARVRWNTRVRPVISPSLLFVVAGASLLSRLLELSPPLLFGVVSGVGVAMASTERATRIVDSGALASARVTTLLIVGAGAWTVLPLLPTTGELMTALLADFVGTLALAGLGSATLLSLPLGTLDGRVILARSPLAWAGLAVLSGTLLAAALAPSLPLENGVVMVTTTALAAVFAVVCLTVWAWARRARPQLR